MVPLVHAGCGVTFDSARPSPLMPSAQRFGAPISCRRSTQRTLMPALASSRAHNDPPGPAPTTTASTSFTMSKVAAPFVLVKRTASGEGFDGTELDADP